ncbi:TPA: hypothetical protein QC153_002179 [Bacillus cereus]|nr:hypothetical protein [Bacillus cereus]
MYMTSEMLDKEIDKLLAQKDLPPVEERNKQVEELDELYYNLTGRHPKSEQLQRLGDYILADTLRDKNTHKTKKEAYPVLSHTQQKLRNRKERRVGDNNLDFMKLKHVTNLPNTHRVITTNKKED